MPIGLIERSVASLNGVGFEAADSGFLAVLESHAGRNAVGIESAAVRSNRVIESKDNLVSTVAY